MKILYIHGLNSNKDSSTGKMVKKYFTKKLNAEVITETFNLLDIEDARKKVYKIIIAQNINVVIASSLGAFVALTLGDAVAKILINPCMLPSTILQSLDPTIPDYVKPENILTRLLACPMNYFPLKSFSNNIFGIDTSRFKGESIN